MKTIKSINPKNTARVCLDNITGYNPQILVRSATITFYTDSGGYTCWNYTNVDDCKEELERIDTMCGVVDLSKRSENLTYRELELCQQLKPGIAKVINDNFNELIDK